MQAPRASEFFILGIEGLTLSEKEIAFLKKNPVGGIILFKRNIESLSQVISLNSSIIEANGDFCPLISVDQEGGRVARLRGICTDLPPMKELEHAFITNPNLCYRIGALQGRELAALGFSLNFSPICDVLSNPENEVIGDRAFSTSEKIVGLLASEYIRGIQGAGVAACAKHYPGHGATIEDSHFHLPKLNTSQDTLFSRELYPFDKAVKSDVATIMTAHVVAESIDALPATISKKALAILREKLAFKNVLISDDLDMKAIADNFSLSDILDKGIRASVDQFIIGNNFDKGMEAISLLQSMIDNDASIKSLVKQSQARMQKIRARFLGAPAIPNLEYASQIVRSSPHLELVNAYR